MQKLLGSEESVGDRCGEFRIRWTFVPIMPSRASRFHRVDHLVGATKLFADTSRLNRRGT